MSVKKSGIAQHILIATAVVVVAIIIGLSTFERPNKKLEFELPETLNELITSDDFTEVNIKDGAQLALVDVRSHYEFERGHLDNAINIASAEILAKENLEKLSELQDAGKTIALYGCHPEEANIPLLLLNQLGFENIKLLPIKLTYEENELVVTSMDVEKQTHDINLFIAESEKKAKAAEAAAKRAATPIVRKSIVVKPKKKKKPEVGC